MRSLLKNRFVLFTTYFLSILFIYTGVSKLLDVGIFQSQIAQSAMLAPYAKILAWLVPIIELVLAGMLLIKHTRVWGLFGSAILMLGFTIYVYLIWTYSPSLPCSCGGVLEAMDWKIHLYFNLASTLLAGTAWYLDSNKTRNYTILITNSVGIIGLVLLLFYTQPQPSILQDDSFTRRYQENTLTPIAEQKLAFNSYYVAGVTDSLVYLGNSTGFTHGIVWNYKIKDTTHFRIVLPDAPESFRIIPKWKVQGDYFFMAEGVTPSIYRGKVDEWTAKEFMPQAPYFSDWVVIDSTRFVLRALQASTQKYVLVDYSYEEPYVEIHDVLKQENGNLFQADGSLILDTDTNQLGYLYFYKNKLPTWNLNFTKTENLDLLYAADLAIINTNKGRDGTHLRDTPTSALHSKAIVHNDHWFVHAQVFGKGDVANGMQNNNFIDVYHNSNGYQSSIAIPKRNGAGIREFYLNDDYLIALYPTELVVYKHKDIFLGQEKAGVAEYLKL